VFVVEQFRLQPVVVVGQSVGGLTALSLAARWPELVRGLVLVDASPSGGGEGVEEAVSAAARALREWPASFGSRSDAQAFFAERFGAGLAVEAWTSGLERVENGWQPRFDVVVMAQTFVASPFYIRAAKAGFEAIDPDLENVAYTLGSSRTGVFFRVAIPAAWAGRTIRLCFGAVDHDASVSVNA